MPEDPQEFQIIDTHDQRGRVVQRTFLLPTRTFQLRHGHLQLIGHKRPLRIGDEVKLNGMRARIINVQYEWRSCTVTLSRFWHVMVALRRITWFYRFIAARLVLTAEVWGCADISDWQPVRWSDLRWPGWRKRKERHGRNEKAA